MHDGSWWNFNPSPIFMQIFNTMFSNWIIFIHNVSTGQDPEFTNFYFHN